MCKKLDYADSVCEALDFIEGNLCEQISVADVTERASISHWQFQRVFRSIVGESIGQYLRQRRLSESIKVIRQTDLRILDVAIQFQFGSQEAFARSFKLFFGLSPKQVREDKSVILPNLKPRVSRESLNHFWKRVQREPKLIDFPMRTLLGFEKEILSPFVDDPDFPRTLPGHWKNTLRKLSGDNERLKGPFYGVAKSDGQEMKEERLSYFAGVETSGEELVEGASQLRMESGMYAAFENVGLAEQTSTTIDYIYGIWLPNSGYLRREGFDFEVFDSRYSFENKDSVSTYYLPVKKKGN